MMRTYRSTDYNWNFNTITGKHERWGTDIDDDPPFSTIGPEIIDLEISSICHGPGGTPCAFCYKSNSSVGKNMSFDSFKLLLDKIPDNVTQIAFGVGDIDSNPDLEKIMRYTRSKGIVPNITINGYRMTPAYYDMLVELCGSVAISHYEDSVCFDAVQELTSKGAKQINIHQVFYDDIVNQCMSLLESAKHDERLKNLNAIVFLMLKPKGRAKSIRTPQDITKFKEIVDKAMSLDIGIGFDSCSAPLVLKTMSIPGIVNLIEPCEAFLFSSYASVDSEFFPCSFCEGEPGWEHGIKINEDTDFIKDIWNNEKMIAWRRKLLTSSSDCNCPKASVCRSCPVFDITPCKTTNTLEKYIG